jgi:hypothetical protein
MVWEEYLAVAVRDVTDKYQARRIKAHIRAQLLDRYQQYRDNGCDQETALKRAIEDLGDATQLAEQLSRPLKYQHGWLWVLAVAQFVIGLAIVAFSLKTESFAALALGRIMAAWGAVSASVQTRRARPVGHHLRVLKWRLRYSRHMFPLRDFGRMAGVGFVTGIFMALVSSLPWNVVTANMFHPVFLSITSALLLSGLVVAVPWMLLRRWVGPAFYVVTLEAWAALSAAIGATTVILWNQAFAPPPLFNWQPDMLLLGGWLFAFGIIRLLAVAGQFKGRVLMVMLDDQRSSLG